MKKWYRLTFTSMYIASVLVGSGSVFAQENSTNANSVVESSIVESVENNGGVSESTPAPAPAPSTTPTPEAKPVEFKDLIGGYQVWDIKTGNFKDLYSSDAKSVMEKNRIKDLVEAKDGNDYLFDVSTFSNWDNFKNSKEFKKLGYDDMTDLIGKLSNEGWTADLILSFNNLEKNYDEFRDLVNTFIRSTDDKTKDKFLPAISLYIQLKQRGIEPFEVVPDVKSGTAWADLYRYVTEGTLPSGVELGNTEYTEIDNVKFKYQYKLENAQEVADKLDIVFEDSKMKLKPKVEDGSTVTLRFHKYEHGIVREGDKMAYGVGQRENVPLFVRFANPTEHEYFEMSVTMPRGAEESSVVESGSEGVSESGSENTESDSETVESGSENVESSVEESSTVEESSVEESSVEESNTTDNSGVSSEPVSEISSEPAPEVSSEPVREPLPEPTPEEVVRELPALKRLYESKEATNSIQHLPVDNSNFAKFRTEDGKELIIPKRHQLAELGNEDILRLVFWTVGQENANKWAEVPENEFYEAVRQEGDSYYNEVLERYSQNQATINDLWMIFYKNKDLSSNEERDLWSQVLMGYYYTLLSGTDVKFADIVSQDGNENFVAMRDAVLGYLSTKENPAGQVYHNYDGSIPFTEYTGEYNGTEEVQGATGKSVLLSKGNVFYWYKAVASDPEKVRIDYHEDGSVEIVPLVLDGSEQTVTFYKYNVDRIKEPKFYYNHGSDEPLFANFSGAGLTDDGHTNYVVKLVLSEFVESGTESSSDATESTDGSENSSSEQESAPTQTQPSGNTGGSSYGGSSNGVSSVVKTDDVRSTYETVEEDVPYETEYVINPKLKHDEKKIVQQGVVGRKLFVYEVFLTNGKETSRVLQSEETKVEPVKQIIEVRAKEGTFDEMLEEPIPFETIERQNNELGKGQERVAQEGVDGKLIATYTVTYENGEVKNKVLKGEPKRVEPLPKIVEKGTADIEVVEEVRKVDVPINDSVTFSIDLAEGEEVIEEQGENGLMEVTYDVTYRNGTEISRTVKTQKLLKEAKPRKVKKGIRKGEQTANASLSRENKSRGGGFGLYALIGGLFLLGIFGLVKALFKR